MPARHAQRRDSWRLGPPRAPRITMWCWRSIHRHKKVWVCRLIYTWLWLGRAPFVRAKRAVGVSAGRMHIIHIEQHTYVS